jgi:hypothetical protein
MIIDGDRANAAGAPPATAVVGIATPSHLHRARCLFESIARHLPHADRHLVLLARDAAACGADEPFTPLPIAGIGLPDFDAFVRRYSAAELAFAAKPWALAAMLARGYQRVIYLDSDIVAYASLEPVVATLDRASILVTPHRVVARERDVASELAILQAGTYNTGFVAVKGGDAASRFLRWWQQKLEHHCIVEVERGLCGDQRYVDLVPGLFDDVAIVRDPGWNVGPWNLDERNVEHADDAWCVNGRPLVFFHFSGFDGAATASQALAVLASDYARALDRHGRAQCDVLPYDFPQPFELATPRGLRNVGRRARLALLRSLHLVTTRELRQRLRESLRARA